MPSIAKSNKWFFRVTLSHANIKLLWNTALSTIKLLDMERCLMISHIGDRTEKEHVHAVIEFSKILQKQSFDVRLKSIFNVSGADYSSKPWDGNMEHGAGSYMYHDPSATEIYCKGFTSDHIDKFKQCNTAVQAIVEENKSRASGRCVDRCLKRIETSDRNWTRREIVLTLLADIKEDLMYECGDYTLIKYVEEIYMKQMAKDDWTQYANHRAAHILRWDQPEIFTEYKS